MSCRLCLRDRQLRLSHVIPEFLYRPLYGPTHQVRSVHPRLPYVRFLRKGLSEPLLCAECEGLIGRYETYFANIWYGAHGLPSEIPAGVGRVVKSSLNYTQFKLFHLSILWRASVATIDEFQVVTLGPHQDRLREMILAGDSGTAMDYRVAASVLLRPGSREVHGGVIGVPARQRHDGGSLYSTVYGGCLWHCIVSREMAVDMDVLQEDGTFRMLVFDIRHVPALYKGLARAAAARRKARGG